MNNATVGNRVRWFVMCMPRKEKTDSHGNIFFTHNNACLNVVLTSFMFNHALRSLTETKQATDVSSARNSKLDGLV